MNKYKITHLSQNTLFSPVKKLISSFNAIETDLISGVVGICDIYSSNRALINNKSKNF